MGDPFRVLLIEDNVGDARLFQEELGAYPEIQIQHASTLAEGLAKVKGTEIDVIFLDLNLPDSQGLKTAQTILEEQPELPVIVITGNKDDALGREAVSLGAQDFIHKDELRGPLLMRAASYSIERKRLLTELFRSSISDPLTGLLNRRGFEQIGENLRLIAKRTGWKLLLFMIDLDDLKILNEEHGHQFGDQAIIDAANLLRDAVRASDLVCRWGGDEFVILAVYDQETSPEIVGQRLKDRLDAFNSQA